MYQKIRKKKSVQCFAVFFIAVVGHEIFFFDVWFLLNQDLHKHTVHRIRSSVCHCYTLNWLIICTLYKSCIQQLRKCMIKNLWKLKGKIQARTRPLSCFFAAEGPWFNLGAYWVVKPLKCVFYNLKGRGPLKNSKKFAKRRGIYGPSIDTTHIPPLFSFYTTF